MDADQVLVGGEGGRVTSVGLADCLLVPAAARTALPPWLRHCFRDTLANLKTEPGEVNDYFEKNM